MNKKLKHNKFNIPDGYFDSIEAKILNKLNNEALPKKDGFSVPESYFVSLEDTIIQKLDTTKKSAKIISISPNFIRKFIPFSIAASFLLFFGIRFFNNSTPNFNNIANNEIEVWLDNNINQIDSYTIADTYENITTDNLTDDIDDEDILLYLENTNTESIINEL